MFLISTVLIALTSSLTTQACQAPGSFSPSYPPSGWDYSGSGAYSWNTCIFCNENVDFSCEESSCSCSGFNFEVPKSQVPTSSQGSWWQAWWGGQGGECSWSSSTILHTQTVTVGCTDTVCSCPPITYSIPNTAKTWGTTNTDNWFWDTSVTGRSTVESTAVTPTTSTATTPETTSITSCKPYWPVTSVEWTTVTVVNEETVTIGCASNVCACDTMTITVSTGSTAPTTTTSDLKDCQALFGGCTDTSSIASSDITTCLHGVCGPVGHTLTTSSTPCEETTTSSSTTPCDETTTSSTTTPCDVCDN